MEYIGKNFKNSDCVIVGVFNALTFLKRRVKYWKIEDFARNYFDYDSDSGFPTCNLSDFFKTWEIDAKLLDGVTQAEKSLLDGNGAIGLMRRKGESTYHLIFLKPDDNRGVQVLNVHDTWVELVLAHSQRHLELSIWSIGKAA